MRHFFLVILNRWIGHLASLCACVFSDTLPKSLLVRFVRNIVATILLGNILRRPWSLDNETRLDVWVWVTWIQTKSLKRFEFDVQKELQLIWSMPYIREISKDLLARIVDLLKGVTKWFQREQMLIQYRRCGISSEKWSHQTENGYIDRKWLSWIWSVGRMANFLLNVQCSSDPQLLQLLVWGICCQRSFTSW